MCVAKLENLDKKNNFVKNTYNLSKLTQKGIKTRRDIKSLNILN